jgi:hypothetical protein
MFPETPSVMEIVMIFLKLGVSSFGRPIAHFVAVSWKVSSGWLGAGAGDFSARPGWWSRQYRQWQEYQTNYRRTHMNRMSMAVFLFVLSSAVHAAETAPPYVPGMGEIMGATQMRHSKLWFAGKAGNWALANYELGEIREGLNDAVIYHPVFKEGVPVSKILGKFIFSPLKAIGSAINAKDSAKFGKAFDSLTMACNSCHQAANRGFIVIQRPGVSPYSNQDFSVKSR